MKTLDLIVWFILQNIVWAVFCQLRMRHNMACICYIATWIAFGLGWFAR